MLERVKESSLLSDALGVVHPSVSPEQDAVRIVSLVPSLTELMYALELGPYLVGRTGFCIHPREELRSVPKVGGTKDVNREKLLALRPTHLLVNIDENEKPCVEALADSVPHIIVTHPQNPHDNLHLYRLLGQVFQRAAQAEKLCERFAAAYQHLQQSLRGRAGAGKKVVYCIWRDPWMTVAPETYIGQMLAEIGWQVVQPQLASSARSARYPSFTWEDPAIAAADLILLSTEPYRFQETHLDEVQALSGKPVLLVDGEMLSWYGDRAIAGLGYLQELSVRGAA